MRRWSVHLSSRLRRPAGFVVALAIVLGAAPRVATWLAAPSFWLDEAMLALNVVGRPLRHLLQPLEYGQTGAPLFLMLSRLAAAAAGATELALRALPLVTGLLLLWLVWRLGQALLGPAGGALGVLLVALSPPLIRYAAEFKPYGPDAALTVLLALVAFPVIERPTDRRRWIGLLLAGIIASAASLSAPMMLVGVLAALALSPRVRAVSGWPARIVGLAAAWATVFGGLYLAVYGAVASDPDMQRRWTATFLDLRARDFGHRLSSALQGLLGAPLPTRPHPWPILPLVLVGCAGAAWAARRRGWSGTALLLGPIAATLAAAMLGRYALAERLVVFLHPLVLLAYAGAAALVLDRLRPAVRGPALLAAAAAIVKLGSPWVIDSSLMPSGREDLRPLVTEVNRRPEGEPLYILGRTLPSYWFYSTDWRAAMGRVDTAATLPLRPGELASVSTGMTWTQAGGWSASAPPPEWGAAESARLAAVARPYAWVLAAHQEPGAVDALVASARALGAHVVWSHQTDGALLLRLRFPGSPKPLEQAQSR